MQLGRLYRCNVWWLSEFLVFISRKIISSRNLHGQRCRLVAYRCRGAQQRSVFMIGSLALGRDQTSGVKSVAHIVVNRVTVYTYKLDPTPPCTCGCARHPARAATKRCMCVFQGLLTEDDRTALENSAVAGDAVINAAFAVALRSQDVDYLSALFKDIASNRRGSPQVLLTLLQLYPVVVVRPLTCPCS